MSGTFSFWSYSHVYCYYHYYYCCYYFIFVLCFCLLLADLALHVFHFLTFLCLITGIISTKSLYFRSIPVQVVGNTTSSCCCYNVNKRIAYAYLPVWLKNPGNEVLVELMGKKYNRTVTPKSLVQMEVTRARLAKKKQEKHAVPSSLKFYRTIQLPVFQHNRCIFQQMELVEYY